MTATRISSHVSRFTMLLVLLQFSAPAAAQGRVETTSVTTRVSVASDGTEGNSGSGGAAISLSERYVAFWSLARNLVSGDTNGFADVFVHDRATGQVTRVSVASDGMQGNGGSTVAAISASGRYVAFESFAINLVERDRNDLFDVFVHDRRTGETTRVSVASDGTEANGGSELPAISASGRYVAFESDASNLVPDDTVLGDVFIHDRQTAQTTRVSVAPDGSEADSSSYEPSISASGRYVAFRSFATNLVSSDTNGFADIFVHDRATGQNSRVSIRSDGGEADNTSHTPSISADGRYVTFWSFATNLAPGDTNDAADVFVHDRATGQTTRVSVASDGTQSNDTSEYPSISADGRYVGFESYATNLVSGDTNGEWDIFLHDRATGQTTRVSVASDGTQGNGVSSTPSISASGRYVGFTSDSSNLVNGDTNGIHDVFIHDRLGAGDGD